MFEPALSDFNIANFGGDPPDDGEAYIVDDVMTGFGMRVSDLIHRAAEDGRHPEMFTLASFLALSSTEKGIRGGRIVARMWEKHCAERGD